MALISSIGEVNLDALDKSIADTAVDIFVYDTRKDSDGGKWRKRTKKTSWYNEELNTATRGSRRDFPAVAVLVLEIGNNGDTALTIYDGDDPDLPMWMVFISNSGSYLQATCNAVYALNGEIVVGRSGAVRKWNYIDECAFSITISNTSKNNGNLSQRNSQSGWYPVSTNKIVGTPINDVAMTVLPNAPIDPATGLPTPTIAVATNGGVSVIKDDGTVVDAVGTTFDVVNSISFDKNNRIICSSGTTGTDQAFFSTFAIPSADLSNVFPGGDNGYYRDTYSSTDLPWYASTGTAGNQFINEVSSYGDYISFGTEDDGSTLNPGLKIISENISNPSEGMLCGVSTSYNTGWMHGNIKGAFLSDTDATNVTGTELIVDGSGNWAGDFDVSSDVSAWTGTRDATLSHTGTAMRIVTNGSTYGGAASKSFTTIIGKTYVASINLPSGGGSVNSKLIINNNVDVTGSSIATNTFGTGTGVYTVTFVATSTTTYIHVDGQDLNRTIDVDDVSVRLAEPDRSVNAKGLQVFGTITKSPVATGAELVGYSGFSGSDYLQMPTGNIGSNTSTNGPLTIMCWFKGTTYTNPQSLIMIGPNLQYEARGLLINPSGQLGFFRWNNDPFSSIVVANNTWNHCVATLSNGNVKLYANGNLVYNDTPDLANSTSTQVRIGYSNGNNVPLLNGSVSLCRVSNSVASPEQIKKIYEDEKVLFQENAKCTLYGSSDAVTALAYDDKTNLLHVGTSSGRSDFKGLRRINNTTTGITTAISASNRLIAEQ